MGKHMCLHTTMACGRCADSLQMAQAHVEVLRWKKTNAFSCFPVRFDWFVCNFWDLRYFTVVHLEQYVDCLYLHFAAIWLPHMPFIPCIDCNSLYKACSVTCSLTLDERGRHRVKTRAGSTTC